MLNASQRILFHVPSLRTGLDCVRGIEPVQMAIGPCFDVSLMIGVSVHGGHEARFSNRRLHVFSHSTRKFLKRDLLLGSTHQPAVPLCMNQILSCSILELS